MNTQNMIELTGVKKHFKVYLDKGDTLKEKIIFTKRNRHQVREVLKGVDIEIPKGQTVGLIGKNGCGKSTTLKLLSRILKPNEGKVAIHGRVSSLIELGAGFHPDMSGRENIYINATIFGLKNKEIDERLEDIIGFSELGDFIDNPVRTYSSGMYMRLAFAVAINVNADILLIDEILAVGDISFQKKCFERLKTIKEQGTTIVIVSHSMDQLYAICDRLIWLENGRVREDGDPRVVGVHYLDAMEEERLARLAAISREKFDAQGAFSVLQLTEQVHPEAYRLGTHEVYITKVDILDHTGKSCRNFDTGDAVTVVFRYAAKLDSPRVNFNMDFVKDNWQYCYGSCFTKPGDELPCLEQEGKVIFRIEELMLLPGQYFLNLGINGEHGEEYDCVRNIIQITVRDYKTNEFGPCIFKHHWEIEHG